MQLLQALLLGETLAPPLRPMLVVHLVAQRSLDPEHRSDPAVVDLWPPAELADGGHHPDVAAGCVRVIPVLRAFAPVGVVAALVVLGVPGVNDLERGLRGGVRGLDRGQLSVQHAA